MAQPDNLPEFAVQDTTLPNGSQNKLPLPEALKNIGYGVDQEPDAQHFNWLFNTIYLWILYFSQGATETEPGIAREATWTEAQDGTGVAAFMPPDKVKFNIDALSDDLLPTALTNVSLATGYTHNVSWPLTYCKIAKNLVCVNGSVVRSGGTVYLGSLPVGFRPRTDRTVVPVFGSGSQILAVDFTPDGAINLKTQTGGDPGNLTYAQIHVVFPVD